MSRRPRDLAVLKMLAAQRTLLFTATASDITPKEVREIAAAHGALRTDGTVDAAAAGHAVVELEASLKSVALPQREAPASARPATFPSAGKRPATFPSAGKASPPPRPAPPPTPARPTAAPSAAGDVLAEVPLEQLLPDPINPRTDVGDVSELAASMDAAGLLQPVIARRTATGQLVVVAGHRRLAAAWELGWATVPVIVRRDMRPDDVLAAMLIENGQRRDLDPIEEARGYARLRAQVGHEGAVAARIGRHYSHVRARLLLLDLPIEEQEALRRGDMTLTEATDRARLASGRVRGDVPRGLPHLGARHPLSARAKARCLQLKHARGRGQGVGGIACGECWESVIRADERRTLHDHSGRTGACALCDHPIPTREDLPA